MGGDRRGSREGDKKSRARMTRDRYSSCSSPSSFRHYLPSPPMAFRSSLAAPQGFASTSAAGPLLASVNGSKFKQTQVASKPAPVLDLPALQAASRVLQEQLVKDSQAVPDLGDMICMCNLVHVRVTIC